MADHMVDRGAHRFRKSQVAHIGRHCALHVDDVVMAQLVQLVRGHARFDVPGNHVQHLRCQLAGSARHHDVSR